MMVKQFVKTAVLFGLAVNTAVRAPLPLKAEEENSEEIPAEILEEPEEEVTEEIPEVTSEEELAADMEYLTEKESLMPADNPIEPSEQEREEEPTVLAGEYSLKTASGSYVIDGANLVFVRFDGKDYWYENGRRQAVAGDPKNLIDEKYGLERGREIFDPGTNAWYWLDSVYDGAKAVGKEVWIPYVYQDEDSWTAAGKAVLAQESDAGMAAIVLAAMNTKSGKWVRYDQNGAMLKGWVTIEGALAEKYPDQVGNTYYYDTRTGIMAKGYVTLGGTEYHFDEMTGVLLSGGRGTPDVQPEPEYSPEPEPTPAGTDFILNTRTGVFHRPTCSAVKKMSDKNKQYVSNTTSEQMRALGYDPCNICNP